MLLVSLLRWWYTTGWSDLVTHIEQRISTALQFFSVGLLIRTLFDPFRQIAAQQVRGPLDAQLRAWGDRVFSRIVGAVVRSIFIVVGLIWSLLLALVGIVQLVLWPVVPFAPIIGIIGMVMGWGV